MFTPKAVNASTATARGSRYRPKRLMVARISDWGVATQTDQKVSPRAMGRYTACLSTGSSLLSRTRSKLKRASPVPPRSMASTVERRSGNPEVISV